MMRWMGMVAVVFGLMACGEEAEPVCEEGAFQCDGTLLQECVADTEAAWEDVEDCADQGLMCHAEMGHCMAEDM